MRKIVYRLKRKRPEISEKRTLLFKQKEFISKNQLKTNRSLVLFDIPERIGIEIIKTTEMINNLSKINAIHWIKEKLWDNLFSLIIEESSDRIRYMYAFIYFEEDQNNFKRDSEFNSIITKSKYSSPKDFISKLEKYILTKSNGDSDSSKYSYVFDKRPIGSKFNHSIEEYLHLFKYIMLSLSGQIDPDMIDVYSAETYRIKVDYGSEFLSKLPRNVAKKEFNQRIATCIYKFCIGEIMKLSKKEQKEHQLIELMDGKI